jgi:hypothetical protein
MKSFLLLSFVIAFSIFYISSNSILKGGSTKKVKDKVCKLRKETKRCGRSENHTEEGVCYLNSTGRCRKTVTQKAEKKAKLKESEKALKEERVSLLDLLSVMNFDIKSYKKIYQKYKKRFKDEYDFMNLLQAVYDEYDSYNGERGIALSKKVYKSLVKSILENKDLNVTDIESVENQTLNELPRKLKK